MKVEPLKYAMHLILSVVTAILSFVIHLHFWLAGVLQADGIPVSPHLANWFEDMS